MWGVVMTLLPVKLVASHRMSSRKKNRILGWSAALAVIATAQEQKPMFAERPRRDVAAASRALARVQAELGNDAVAHARLREGHLPEARFTWEPIS